MSDPTPPDGVGSARRGAPQSAARHGAPQASGPAIPLRAAALLVLINVLWAGSALNGKDALDSIGPYTLSFLRFAPSCLLLWLVLRLRGTRVTFRRADAPRLFLYGAVGIALTYALYYNGMRGTTATESTLLIASEPVWIALIARLTLGERLRPAQSGGLALGFVGVYLIIAQGLTFHASPGSVGNALIALALVFECWASVVGKELSDRMPGLVVVMLGMGIGAVLLGPLAAVELLRHPPGALGWATWANIAYVSLLSSAFCYGVWFWLLPRYDVSAMGGFLFIQPVMGAMLGIVFRGERLAGWTAGGAALVLAGVWLIAVTGRRPDVAGAEAV